MGELVPGQPWTYLPEASRLYFRKSQLPVGEKFQTKTAAAVEMLRQADGESKRSIFGVQGNGFLLKFTELVEERDLHL